MNRRDFLKISALTIGGVLVPPPQIEWPPGVVTRFNVARSGLPNYCLTLDDGWSARVNAPFIIFCADHGLFPFTWFTSRAGLYAAKDENAPILISKWIRDMGCTVGYHTLDHPSLTDQLKNYNRSRWIEDYEEWLEIALSALDDSIIQPFARAAGGLFADPFMEMCDEKGLTAYGWSQDPYVLSRGSVIQRGDIVLLHFRDSDWPWFNYLADRENTVYRSSDVRTFEELEELIVCGDLADCSNYSGPPCYYRR